MVTVIRFLKCVTVIWVMKGMGEPSVLSVSQPCFQDPNKTFIQQT